MVTTFKAKGNGQVDGGSSGSGGLTSMDRTPRETTTMDVVLQFQRARRRKILVTLLLVLMLLVGAITFRVVTRPRPCERLVRSLCDHAGTQCPPALIEAFLQKGTQEKCMEALGALDDAPEILQSLVRVQIIRDILRSDPLDAQINAFRAQHGLPPMEPMEETDDLDRVPGGV